MLTDTKVTRIFIVRGKAAASRGRPARKSEHRNLPDNLAPGKADDLAVAGSLHRHRAASATTIKQRAEARPSAYLEVIEHRLRANNPLFLGGRLKGRNYQPTDFRSIILGSAWPN